METPDLFNTFTPEEDDAQVVLRASKSTLGRAQKVIEHWLDAAQNPRYEGGNWISGDCLNPLANREHDALWEYGDGNQVSAIVRQEIRNNVDLAHLITSDSLIQRYADRNMLKLANAIIAKEESKRFDEIMVKNVLDITTRQKSGANTENVVRNANSFVSDQKTHGYLNENELQNWYSVIQSAAFPEKVNQEPVVNNDFSPHELTSAEFASIARAVKLENHGRQWEVFFGNKSLGFCDSPSAPAALNEAHLREVNNALYSNSPDTPEFMEKLSMPSDRVLAEYPELRVTFAEMFAPQQKEKCWKIRTEFPVKAKIVGGVLGWNLAFEPMTISYDDYEKLGNEIDRDRVYVDGVNVYDFAWQNGLRGIPPCEINGKMVLPGKSGGSYSYVNGKANFGFCDEIVCREHANRLAERGLISLPELKLAGIDNVTYSVGSPFSDTKEFRNASKAAQAFLDEKSENRPYVIRSEIQPNGRDSASFVGMTSMSERDGIKNFHKFAGLTDVVFKDAYHEVVKVVKEGTYSGKVLDIADGVVTQKINREGDTVRHDVANLSATVNIGDVIDIQYHDGTGLVAGKDKSVGVGR